ncbi:MAG: UDP-N-acetylglucosamine 2-epimerase (non-hydrolyzing) [Thermodesulfobacteriota bacterium]
MICHIVGARPNFMKAAPVIQALKSRGIPQRLIHTGQHYDTRMSDIFFEQLCLPEPDFDLDVGSGSHAVQTAQVMMKLEPVLLNLKPDMVLVYGDVNSTVAASIVCAKLGVKIGHVEAGLRSFDRTMPEEINRIITDQLADFLFTTSTDGDINLKREGIAEEKIFCVGNVMIDTLVHLLPLAENFWNEGKIRFNEIYVDKGRYILVTLHRPSNVDNPKLLNNIINALSEISQNITVLFPMHPRTQKMFQKSPVIQTNSNFQITKPLGYLEFLSLQQYAKVVITDSGGIQEETTFLGVPCLTMRSNTERPVTVSMGTNILVGQDAGRLLDEVSIILNGNQKIGRVPPLWDGHASSRIADILTER